MQNIKEITTGYQGTSLFDSVDFPPEGEHYTPEQLEKLERLKRAFEDLGLSGFDIGYYSEEELALME